MQELVKQETNYIYSAKEIWELSNSSSRSWDRFVAEFLTATDGEQKKDYLEEHPSRSGGNRYTEKTLKAFQMWLMKNQANQGRTSQVVKQATMNNLQAGVSFQVIIDSGNEEAFDEYMGRMRELFNAKRNLKLEQQHNKQLVEENNYLKKLTDFQSTQIEYYTKKYHSWYDDYENY